VKVKSDGTGLDLMSFKQYTNTSSNFRSGLNINLDAFTADTFMIAAIGDSSNFYFLTVVP
jgi:hypothetical protein